MNDVETHNEAIGEDRMKDMKPYEGEINAIST